MRINYNVSAMISNNALANTDNKLSASLQRLSTGFKVNRAKDNPAGLAMSKRMNAQIEGVKQASQNASDGVSVIEIADGALSEVADMLQRMNELCVKSATDTMTEGDRKIIQSEIAQLKEEVARVSKTTQFNGQNLLDGSFARKGYAEFPDPANASQMRADIKVSDIGDSVEAGTYTIGKIEISKTTVNGVTKYSLDALEIDTSGSGDSGFPDYMTGTGTDYEIRDGILTLNGKGTSTFEIKLDVSGLLADPTAPSGSGSAENIKLDILDVGAMVLQIGANETQTLNINIPNMSLKNYGLEDLDVSTSEGALDGIDRVKGAMTFLSGVRASLGAYQNRLEHTVSSLDVTEENMTAAYSRLIDVDMAEEMTQYSTLQVMSQAGISMLAQANERPSTVLQLLQ